MTRYNQDFLEQQITRFQLAKEALENDTENYKNHEEKKTDLLAFYDTKIKEYQAQLEKLTA